MQSKQRMRERVIDIFSGAGLYWLEDDEYFDGFSLEGLGNAINGIEYAFGLGNSSRLKAAHELKAFDQVDTTVELIRECIECDS